MRTRKLVAGILLAGALTAGTVIASRYSSGPDRAYAVEVRNGGQVVSLATVDDAVAEVSRQVAFDVKLPTQIPPGLRLVAIDYSLGPEGVSNSLKIATLFYGAKDEAKRGSVLVGIDETGVRFGAPDGRAQKIDIGVPGTDAYFQRTERSVGYWLFTADRGFTIAVTGEEQPTDAEMRAMIASLAQ